MPEEIGWPTSAPELVRVQETLAELRPPLWRPPERPVVGGCFVCFPRGGGGTGRAGDPAWAGAAACRGFRVVGRASITGHAGAGYLPGLLALRAGALLADAVRALPVAVDVLLVDGTGDDHPRRAGLARHLGAVLDVPSIGVTHRPLGATGDWPPDERGARSPLYRDRTLVGYWLRTRTGRRPLAVHAGWRTDPEVAVAVVAALTRARTPAPLREARRIARDARARAEAPEPPAEPPPALFGSLSNQ